MSLKSNFLQASGYRRKSGLPCFIILLIVIKVAGTAELISFSVVTNILPSIKILFVNGICALLKDMFM